MTRLAGPRKTAFLIEDLWPEFEMYVRNLARPDDEVFVQHPSQNLQGEWGSVRAQIFRLWRSWKLRSALFQGITVAKAHFELAETLARIFGKQINYDVEHLCVSQTLLPHLWRAGLMGGRTFDVLISRLPVTLLEKELDRAASLYPESRTLSEFRAPRWFAQAEEEALAAARTLITPHPQIAHLFTNSTLLEWKISKDKKPAEAIGQPRDLIVFFGPTLARKGAHAVREIVKQMGIRLTVVGSELEGDDFWRGLSVTHETAQHLRWERIHTVLQPSLFEFSPRQLLRAQTAGSRLLISPLSGIDEDHAKGIYHVPFGDTTAAIAVMKTILRDQERVVSVR
jgi:hypothetical protein